jgi:hypothetical protein
MLINETYSKNEIISLFSVNKIALQNILKMENNEIRYISFNKKNCIIEKNDDKYILKTIVEEEKKKYKKEAVMKTFQSLKDGTRYKLMENVLVLDKSFGDFFNDKNDTSFGEDSLKQIINSLLVKDNSMASGEIVVYNDEEKSFVNEKTDSRLFLSNDNLTFKIEEIQANEAEGEENTNTDLGSEEPEEEPPKEQQPETKPSPTQPTGGETPAEEIKL